VANIAETVAKSKMRYGWVRNLASMSKRIFPVYVMSKNVVTHGYCVSRRILVMGYVA
jgi:hypothetical protein